MAVRCLDKNQIGTDLGVVVPMILFLQGPSIEELTPSVLAAMETTPSGEGAQETDWEEGSL